MSVSHPEAYPREAKWERIRNDEPKTHHFTNTTTATGDQHNFTVDTEEILNVEGGHGYEFEGRSERARASLGPHGN